MKIGIDCRLWSQKGVGRYIKNLVENLQEIDKKNEYFLFARSQDREDLKIQSSNFKIIDANIPWHSVKEQILFPKILNKEKLDLIHFTYTSLPVFYKGPFVLTVHDLIPFHFTTGRASTKPLIYGFKKLGYRFVISKAVRKAKKIIVPSNFTKEEIINNLSVDSGKIDVVREGVRNIKTSKGKLIKDSYFLYVGNAYPHKNLETLIKAFEEIENKNIKLVLVGKKDYFYAKLEKSVKSSNIIFYGEVIDNDLISLYKNAIAYVIPSFMEGFGLTGLEAMSNNCLVLSSDIPVHHEIYKDNVLYFNPINKEDLKNLMDEVLENPLIYKERIKKAFESTKSFSWQKMARETLRIYESSIGLR